MIHRLFEYGGLDNDPLYSCINATATVPLDKMAGTKAPVFGVAYIVYGLIVQTCYALTLPMFLDKDLWQMSCYKLMFAMGIVDSLVIFSTCHLTGYFMIIGNVFCMNPTLSYIGGAWAVVSFDVVSTLCLFLVFNRIVDFWRPKMAEKLFRGGRAWIFVLVAFIYGLLYLFEPLILFNAEYGTWIYDPLIPGSNFHVEYNNFPQAAHNVCIVGGMCVLYALLFILHTWNFKKLRMSSASTRKFQRKLLIQSSLVCVFTFSSAAIWSSTLIIRPSITVMHIGHASWQLMHGTPSFVYLLVNRTIQQRVIKRYFSRFIKLTSKIAQKSTTIRTTTQHDEKSQP